MDQYRLDLEKKLQQSPIDDSAILSHVYKVIARHEKHLEKSRRPKRFRVGYLTILALGLIAIAMMVSPLSDLFQEKTATKSVMPLVEGNGIRIMPDEFFLYKSNVEEVNKQPGMTPIHLSDEQIIDSMIEDQLTVQYAKKMGIVASPAEIDNLMASERASLEQAEKDNPASELMANRIKRSGLSEEEFWESELTRRHYENAILAAKLSSKLAQDGTIKIGDGSGWAIFKKELLAKNKDKLTINWSAVNDPQHWRVSPTFKITNGYVLRGEEGRLGFIDGPFQTEHGLLDTSLIAGKPNKYMWHFWGDPEQLKGAVRIVAINEQGQESEIYSGSLGGPLNGAQAAMPSSMGFPTAGLWKLKVFVGEELFGEVIIKVLKETSDN